jgi:dCMP deaminase
MYNYKEQRFKYIYQVKENVIDNSIIYDDSVINSDFSDNEKFKFSAYMEVAMILSKLSHCVSKKVSAIIINKGRIISTGINGTPSNVKNCDEIFSETNFKRTDHHTFSEQNEIHAEANAIARAASNSGGIAGSDIFLTLSPCSSCSKLIVASGIKRVFFKDFYDIYIENDSASWINYFIKNGISIYRMSEKPINEKNVIE